MIEWRKHDGRGMPVLGNQIVSVKLGSNETQSDPRKAEYWEWNWERPVSDRISSRNMTYSHVRDLLGLFRNGYDSLEISYIAGIPEPAVYNQLHEQREAERLKAPKPRRATVLFSEFDDQMLEELRNTKWNETELYYPKLIPYAGKDD